MLQLGEETGRLGEMALRVATIHDDQIQQTVQRLVALMVPVITIVMGVVVAESSARCWWRCSVLMIWPSDMPN